MFDSLGNYPKLSRQGLHPVGIFFALLLRGATLGTFQTLHDGAELLHGVGGVDLTAYTHDTHQATTAHA
nr:MAG TPA: hypothetical protein [Caudoviricetes sp.]